MSHRTAPLDTDQMPPGIPHIIGNEAAERFSFYGMKAILVVFMTQYLWLMGNEAGTAMTEVKANQIFHTFGAWVYFTPLIGALISDLVFGKYNVIIWLSLVYCAGHAALALMGVAGDPTLWLYVGLGLIAIGAGGIKPCVSAHVGDQFGSKNQHLLVKIFNWFYFSINLGSFASTALTPWTLEWYGPHVAFGIPGILMAIATLMFWMGRKQFAHLPAKPEPFIRELFSREGLFAILKLLPMVGFVAVFWSLFDQTGSSWIFQAQDMDCVVFGEKILPSQIQAVNPIMILVLIPIFAYGIYPAIDKVWKLTALRKIGIGLFLAASAFVIPSIVQEWISAGERPHIGWHVLAYLLLTMAEIMVSVVGLEFFYTQSPKRMKSVMMSLWLLSVFLGNQVIAVVNHYIEVPNVIASKSSEERVVNAGYDGQNGTSDDIIVNYEKEAPKELSFSSKDIFEQAVMKIEMAAADGSLPSQSEGEALVAGLTDAWGQPLVYRLQNSGQARIRSAGPDKVDQTEWDLGVLVQVKEVPEEKDSDDLTWIEKRKIELGYEEEAPSEAEANSVFKHVYFVGGSQGMTTMEGASYFWFFTWLMLGTAIVFVPFAIAYRPKAYVPDAVGADPMGEVKS